MQSLKLRTLLSSIAVTGILSISSMSFTANASILLNWGEGDAGFGALAMERNDDDSSGEIVFNNQVGLAFDSGVNFFGNFYHSFYINNNGNITFNDSLSGYTPEAFPISGQPMIAPFWGDVDTGCDTCGEVYVGSPNENTMVVTWNNVGFFSANDSLTNSFQLVLIDRSDDFSAGDFDVEFRYEDLNWTTGDASDGENGLGGTPAQAGYDAGNNTDFYALPGSFTADVLELQNTSNTGVDGIWTFSIRDGVLPGNTPANPVLPIIDLSNPTEYKFELVITNPTVPVFIDPDVAVGYDYVITDPNSPLFASVILPVGFDNNLFDLFLWDGGSWVFDSILTGGIEHFFSSAVDRFRIMGIDISNMVDPTDVTAFVTGVTFNTAGNVFMTQSAITEFVDNRPANGIPEPSLLIIILGSAFVLLRRKRFAL